MFVSLVLFIVEDLLEITVTLITKCLSNIRNPCLRGILHSWIKLQGTVPNRCQQLKCRIQLEALELNDIHRVDAIQCNLRDMVEIRN
jgi:hypothetical protein